MTQEEKARAYDEAMNKIKPLYEQAKKDGNPIWSTYEYLIPQLAESEDERIRKEIIEYLWDISNQTPLVKESLDCRRWIAYLEKQKEQKPAEWSEEDEASYNAFICEVVNEKMNPTIEQVKWLRGICDRLKSLSPSWKPSEDANVEYIRKDTLIEWAKENIDSLGRLSYGEFIGKLNSM